MDLGGDAINEYENCNSQNMGRRCHWNGYGYWDSICELFLYFLAFADLRYQDGINKSQSMSNSSVSYHLSIYLFIYLYI